MKTDHLDMIQGVIDRMAGNSFLLKGWAVAIVSALFAIGEKEQMQRLLTVAYIPVVIFWLLDAYYLRIERLYRRLYDRVRGLEEAQIDYSMNPYFGPRSLRERIIPFWNPLLVTFYGALFCCILVVSHLAK
jgi:hypothetical protein